MQLDICDVYRNNENEARIKCKEHKNFLKIMNARSKL
jgi:hypothetical protein